ncbi:DNA mismatch repair protein [Linderina pennispora]|nr:DNA mismatch repair protein [Linderina pennispora]
MPSLRQPLYVSHEDGRHDRRPIPKAKSLVLDMDNDSLDVADPQAVLQAAAVIGQADNKFIMCQSNGVLLAIDQHAADERIRLEHFYSGLSAALAQISGLGVRDTIAHVEGITLLMPPVQIVLSRHDCDTALSQADKFRRLGFVIREDGRQNPQDMVESHVVIECAPTVLVSRFTGDMRRVDRYAKELVLAITQWQPLHSARGVRALSTSQQHSQPAEPGVEAADGWPVLANVPPLIVESLKSIACRGAIKFNDPLSHCQCRALVRDLARCRFAGFCAHGR